MIALQFGVLCDYATMAEGGKLVIVGVFDLLTIPKDERQVLPVSFMLVARLSCRIVDGSLHEISFKFVDEDEESVIEETSLGQRAFMSTGRGRPLAIQVIAQIHGFRVSGARDHRFVIRVDGEDVGEVPLYVQLPLR